MSEQLSLLEKAILSDNLKKMKKRVRRRWEYAFQKWSNEHGIESANNTTSYGCCGFAKICDYCKDNSYGKPCVRALNAMLREQKIEIDYSDRDFEKIWRGEIK